ncbi:MAG: putative replication initiation protein [Cressdnaviricota sp.]|nr:MAG: putative replication initiation protein [Cressdnaviricota sp.]
MYKKLREELINENILLLERCKAMGINIWPGTDRTVEDVMVEVDKNSQEILKQKFGYGESGKQLKEKDLKSYYFITINLEGNKEQVKELYDKMGEAIHRYKWLRKSIFNIEYYTKKGGHPHTHIYVDTDKRRDTIIHLLSKFFKIKENYLDIKRYYGNPINHINYIKGIKKEESKEEYIDKDDKLRDEYNIPKFIDNMGGNELIVNGSE